MIGVSVVFDFDGNFDRSQVVEVAKNAVEDVRGPLGPSLQGLHPGREGAEGDELLRVGLARGGGSLLHRRASRESDWVVRGSTDREFLGDCRTR